MKKKAKNTLQARIHSFGYAWAGIVKLIATQPNARIHLSISLLVTAAGFLLGISSWEWCVLVISMGMVWMAEAMNTAIEILTDRVSTETHPMSKSVKDIAAAGVLLASVFAAIVGLIVFLPHILPLIGIEISPVDTPQ